MRCAGRMKRNRIFVIALALTLIALWLVAAPPRWWLNLTKQVEVNDKTGAMLVDKYECRNCHRIDGRGALKAVELDGVTRGTMDDAIRLWLREPQTAKNNTSMPNFDLSDSEIEAILVYLKAVDQRSP